MWKILILEDMAHFNGVYRECPKHKSLQSVFDEILSVMRIVSKNARPIEVKQVDKFFANGGVLFLAVKDGSIVGSAQLTVNETINVSVGKVDYVSVTESCRGNGIGKKLMTELIAKAKGMGLVKIMLTSDPTNPERHKAIDLYRSLGFISSNSMVMNMPLQTTRK